MLRVAVILAGLFSSSAAGAHGFTIGDLAVTHPFFRETPPSVDTGAGYMVVTNNGASPDRLLAIETPAAAKVEFHQTIVENGVATMRPVENGFEIAPGSELVIGDEGTHAMLVGVTQPIRQGELIDATLVFEKAGRLEMYFEVEPLGKLVDQHRGDHAQ